ncbi:MAG: PSD1 domain-containing protein [Planctomycetales bacterium]|nr:PSD1 domain-containing protein [Planctomycetales bacterium]
MVSFNDVSIRVIVAVVLAMFLRGQGVADEPAEHADYFERHIRPLLIEHCYECHSVQSGKQEGGLLLDSREGWKTGGESGPAIVPGKVDESPLIGAVRGAGEFSQMPPARLLPQPLIAKLEHWVRIGAPDPRDGADTTPREVADPIAGRAHWAFQPLAFTAPPNASSEPWPRSAIDQFVIARLKEADLPPAPDATPAALARRLHLQLTGLPPTAAELRQFLEDQRPDAVARLVDRLLDSPRFGERWGRHWLDLARYADSNGLDENFLFREAWRYRNWVIDAVNRDVPYDRFLLEQIAGDLLPFDSIDQRDRQRIAAGFLVVGPKVLLGNDPRQRKMDVADEQVDTIGRAVLGMTVGCARCHNHKFDPIPTRDYYALAGIFTSTEVMEQRFMLNEQRTMERLAGLGDDGELDVAYEKYYRELPGLRERAKQAKAALELVKQLSGGEEAAAKASGELETLAKQRQDAVAPAALDTQLDAAKRSEAQQALVTELDTKLAQPPPIPPRAMIPADAEKPAHEHIRLAGQFDRTGDLVPRGFLQVLSDGAVAIPDDQSGREHLAHWLTDTRHGAGQLAARVYANRIWRHLIGRGIVRTADNFGRTGEQPSHPELLDYLADELIRSGWSTKALIRQIVLSRTFAMSSQHDAKAHEVDPENLLLWRAHRRRLDPESFRDSLRLAAGTLDLNPMDSTVWYLGDQATAVGDNKNRRRTDFPSRSVYLPVIRNDLPELFDVFDFADPQVATGMRPETMVAPQGLFMLNDDSLTEASTATARRIQQDVAAAVSDVDWDGDVDVEKRDDLIARRMFELILGEAPTDSERQLVVDYVRAVRQRGDGKVSEGAAGAEKPAEATDPWALACHALFASSRFQMVE